MRTRTHPHATAAMQQQREFRFDDDLVISRERTRNPNAANVFAALPGRALTQYSWRDRAAFLATFCAGDFFSPNALVEVTRTLVNDNAETYSAWYYRQDGPVLYRDYAGFITMSREDAPGYANPLLYICVRPEFRGQRRIGERLLLWYETLVARREPAAAVPPYIVINSLNTAAARQWYQRRGYRYLRAGDVTVPAIGPAEADALRRGDELAARAAANTPPRTAYEPVIELAMIKAPFRVDANRVPVQQGMYSQYTSLQFFKLLLPYTVANVPLMAEQQQQP